MAAKKLPSPHPWRLVFGLACFAGLRTQSETHRLTWADVDWDWRRLTVFAPKTGMTRIVPITADLYAILQVAFDAAPEGKVKLVQLGAHRSNLHRGLEKIILRAGLVPWDDLFQTLRSCAETDFARKYPQHEVSRWTGQSLAASEKHYLMSDTNVMDSAASAPPLLRSSKLRQLVASPINTSQPRRIRCDGRERHKCRTPLQNRGVLE